MGFFLLAGLFAAAAGIGFMSDDDDDAPDSNPANPNRNSGGGTGDDDDDNNTPSGPRGTAGGDELILTGDDSVHALGGWDMITAKDDATAYGDTGSDRMTLLDRSTGYGGYGTDYLTAKDNATADGDRGNDNLQGEDQVTLYGGAGDDSLWFERSLDDPTDQSAGRLFGGAGDDRIYARDILRTGGNLTESYGGDGNDVIYLSDTSRAFGDDGNDTLLAYSGGTLTGGAGNDLFTVSSRQFNSPLGGEENDTVTITDFTKSVDQIRIELSGAPKAVTLSDDGTDTTLSITWDPIEQNSPGADPVNSNIVVKGVTGLTLDDFVIGRDAFGAFSNSNGIRGDGAYDRLTNGTSANDVLTLTGDQPLAMMGAGNDSVTGGDGTRIGLVTLSDGDDSYTDGSGRMIVFGGAGNDSYISDGSNPTNAVQDIRADVFFGGDGNDSATILANTPASPADDLVSELELVMNAGNDTVTVDRNFDGDVFVSDGAGDDTVSAWMGSTVTSGDGNDSISFGIDADHVTLGRAPAEIRDLSATDRLILDIDEDLTAALTARYVPSSIIQEEPTTIYGEYTELLLGDVQVAIIWDQNLALNDPRLTINRGVAFA